MRLGGGEEIHKKGGISKKNTPLYYWFAILYISNLVTFYHCCIRSLGLFDTVVIKKKYGKKTPKKEEKCPNKMIWFEEGWFVFISPFQVW